MKKLPIILLFLMIQSCMIEPVITYDWVITRYIDCTSVPKAVRFPKSDSNTFEYNSLESDVYIFINNCKIKRTDNVKIGDTTFVINYHAKYRKKTQ